MTESGVKTKEKARSGATGSDYRSTPEKDGVYPANSGQVEYLTLGRAYISRGFHLSEIVKVFPDGSYKHYLRIDQRMGKDPKTGETRWNRVFIHDYETATGLYEALGRMMDGLSYHSGIVFEENREATSRLKELGIDVTQTPVKSG